MARITLSFYAVCFILALTGSALPAKSADPSSSASAVAPSGKANYAYDMVKVRYTLNTPEGPVIDKTQSVTHMAQELNKEFDDDDDETPKPTPTHNQPVLPTPSSSGPATQSLKDDYEEQTAQKVHDLEEPSSSPKPKANAQTEPTTEEPPTEERKQSEPAPTPTPTPTPTKQQHASGSSAAPAASSSVYKDDAIKKFPVIGPLLNKVL